MLLTARAINTAGCNCSFYFTAGGTSAFASVDTATSTIITVAIITAIGSCGTTVFLYHYYLNGFYCWYHYWYYGHETNARIPCVTAILRVMNMQIYFYYQRSDSCNSCRHTRTHTHLYLRRTPPPLPRVSLPPLALFAITLALFPVLSPLTPPPVPSTLSPLLSLPSPRPVLSPYTSSLSLLSPLPLHIVLLPSPFTSLSFPLAPPSLLTPYASSLYPLPSLYPLRSLSPLP